jgi:hypothetical protein
MASNLSKYYIDRLNSGRSYIECPFDQKDSVKKLGARWDPHKKKWYIPPGKNVFPFLLWKPKCKKCGGTLSCDYERNGVPCENTQVGVCCEYDYSGDTHCTDSF